ncbi:N-acetyltransferase family protein [Phenylobacterium sp. J426]|uniref:GNAT family N-acetyltransferase n=1 Tax=Phenylobacterium sp. J426 TaxID=2898439 RepID=UPI00215096BF|nr:GNAT family N-acetyltransferase [Phenylobacterium sp. J426]MCR5872982.1 N-acetyltransferase family protein [Phenylobacterium sp. J426]
MILRAATEDDTEALAAIYDHHVLHGFGTFELEPPGVAWMEAKRRDIQGYGLPFVVAELGRKVLGYAYAGPFRPRPGYRFTVEDSVYVAPDAVGRGVGRATLAAVLDQCAARGLRQVVAVIGDSGNAASVGLHRALGFQDAGVFRDVGFKHGRWVDIVMMQKPLNGGGATLPDGPGVSLG